jgi:hypothetical protein
MKASDHIYSFTVKSTLYFSNIEKDLHKAFWPLYYSPDNWLKQLVICDQLIYRWIEKQQGFAGPILDQAV